ncbi:MAG TPA: hypothetical protein VM100_05020 [Longimicrobiales bacterium]|nr:hypothetical protein [Longimicrobiales bacterium]
MKSETLENLASWTAGVAAAAFFTILFVAVSSPVAETVQKFVS